MFVSYQIRQDHKITIIGIHSDEHSAKIGIKDHIYQYIMEQDGKARADEIRATGFIYHVDHLKKCGHYTKIFEDGSIELFNNKLVQTGWFGSALSLESTTCGIFTSVRYDNDTNTPTNPITIRERRTIETISVSDAQKNLIEDIKNSPVFIAIRKQMDEFTIQ